MSLMLSSRCRSIAATTVWLLMQQQPQQQLSLLGSGKWMMLANAFTILDRRMMVMVNNNNHHHHRMERWMSSNNNDDDDDDDDDGFGNRMQEWSIEDDWFLYRHYQDDSPEYVAKKLGRGIRGVEARWSKLNSVSSPAYRRLFTPSNNNSNDNGDDDNDSSNNSGKKEKLVPVQEVLQRIQWDPALEANDFVIWYKDRYQMDGKLMTSPFNAPNVSVKGKEPLFVKAIPPHRIQAIQYKADYIIWDKDARLYHDKDLITVASEDHYRQWKAERLTFQKQLCQHLQHCLGHDKFQSLKDSSSQLLQNYKSSTNTYYPETMDDHIQFVLTVFQSIYHPPTQNDNDEHNDNDNNEQDTDQSLHDESINRDDDDDDDNDLQEEPTLEDSQFFVEPTSDIEALQLYLDLVSFLPHYDLRTKLTRSVQNQIVAFQQKQQLSLLNSNSNSSSSSSKKKNQQQQQSLLLPRLNEDDLEEKFVRGSGNGGQKVNKTSNRVILLHIPTQLRVECQDTRSLQQNRKIARKRLQQKLDYLMNGTMSKKSKAQQKIRKKKQQKKSRSKAKKLELAEKQQHQEKEQEKEQE